MEVSNEAVATIRGGYARNCRNEESNGSYLISKRIVGSEEVMED